MSDAWLARVGEVAERVAEKAPGGAGLEGAVTGVFFIGIFGDGFLVGLGKPALDVEDDDVEVVLLVFGQCDSLGHAFEEGQAWAFGRIHSQEGMSIWRAKGKGEGGAMWLNRR